MAEEMLMEQTEVIDSDVYAERVIRRLQDSIAERDRLVATCKEQAEFYKNRAEEIEDSYKARIDYDTAILKVYFGQVSHKETKTTESYKLPSGTLKLTKASKTLVPDREKLVGFLEAEGSTEYVKVKKDVDWAELKKTISIVDGKAVWEQTGEVLDCVAVEDKPESFEVK